MQTIFKAQLTHLSPKWTAAYTVYVCLIALLLLIFALNHFTPLWGDDWWRALEADNALHMFKRIRDEYTSWTGRASVLFLTFVFLLKYPGSVLLFNIVNTLVLCALVLGIFRSAAGRFPGKQHADAIPLLLIFFSLWFFTRAFGEAVLWKTGAIAYLWVVTAAVFLLTPFVDLLVEHQAKADTRVRKWLYPLFAVFWAATLENVAVSCCCFMLYSLLASLMRGIKIARWYWHVLVAQCVGTLILVIAPGNFVRFARQDDGKPLWLRFGKLAETIWQQETTRTYLFIVIAGMLLVLALMNRRFNLQRFYLWFIVGLLFAFTMIGSTGISYGNRTAFVAEVAFVVALANLFYPLLQNLRPLYIYPLPILVLIFGLWGADCIKVFEQYLATWQQTQRREELMQSYREHDIKRILLPSMIIPYSPGLRDNIVEGRYFLRDIHLDSPGNGWRNGTFGKYHYFEFANRIKKPYLIFEPELNLPARFKPVANVDLPLYFRSEKFGFKQNNALYLVANKRECRKHKKINVHPVEVSDLPHRDKKNKFTEVKGEQNVAWVTTKGQESKDRCIVRFALPSWDIKDIAMSGRQFPLHFDKP